MSVLHVVDGDGHHHWGDERAPSIVAGLADGSLILADAGEPPTPTSGDISAVTTKKDSPGAADTGQDEETPRRSPGRRGAAQP